MALHRLMEMTANNMANMSTPGFKSQNVLFGEYLNKTQDPASGSISEVQESGTYRDLAQGTLTQTSNKLDFALQGEGYFAVQTPSGVRYTRDGSFALNSKGEITTKDGDPVLNDTGSPLTIQPGATQITMNRDNSISTEKGTVGKLKVVTFGVEQAMTPIGNNLYEVAKAQEKPVSKPQIEQGMLENSNVQPILEMNKMIDVLRNYQAAQNLVINDHDRIRAMIQQLTRV